MVKKLKFWWHRLHKNSFGRWLFSKFIGFFIPYSGSISPYVEEIKSGFALVGIKQHRKILNHLNSIHAIALVNLGELTTGLALHFAMKDNNRAILVGLNIVYTKKARGYIRASCSIDLSKPLCEGEHELVAILRDERDDNVAKVTAKWLLDVK